MGMNCFGLSSIRYGTQYSSNVVVELQAIAQFPSGICAANTQDPADFVEYF